MPSDPSKAGKIGGSRNTPAQIAARKRNGFQPRKAEPIERPEGLSEAAHTLAACRKHDPNARKPLTSYPEYSIYRKAKSRCTNRNAECWPDYGGRGIEFRFTSFEEFFAHLGPRPTPSHSVDRYPNNDGHYEPGNVRWATPTEQSNNQRPKRVQPPTLPIFEEPVLETLRRAITTLPAPSNRKSPTPPTEPDELKQEAPSDDMS